MEVQLALVGFFLLAVVSTVWIAFALFFGHWIGRASARAPATLRGIVKPLVALHHTLAFAPALWLAAATTLVLRAVWTIGEWPRAEVFRFLEPGTPSNIEPGVFGAHHAAALLFVRAAWISLLVFPPLHFALQRRFGARGPVWFAGWLVTGLAGLLLSIYEGPYGVAEWIL